LPGLRRNIRTQVAWKVIDPDRAARVGSEQLGDALAHLAGRLVGEGDREDRLVRTRQAACEEIRDAVDEDARLAGSRACEDEQRPPAVLDRLALFGVQALEERRRVGGGRFGGGWHSRRIDLGAAAATAPARYGCAPCARERSRSTSAASSVPSAARSSP
jgi:hypothetical protein